MSMIGELFLIMLVGFYASKSEILNEEMNKGLSSLLINITVPLLIISSFNIEFTSEMISNILKSFWYSIGAFGIVILISNLMYFKIKEDRKPVLKFATIFSNCAFMGFSIIQSLYGNEGLAYASVFNMIFTILLWSYGAMLFNGEKNIKNWTKALINPGIISVFIGMFIMVLSIKIPSVIQSTMKMVGGMTTPLSMIITGSMLAQVSIKKEMTSISLYYGTFVKLIIVPLILYFITVILNIKSLPLNIIIVCEAMPVGAMTSIFAATYNKDKEFAGLSVFVSTLFSIVTIPLILKIIS